MSYARIPTLRQYADMQRADITARTGTAPGELRVSLPDDMYRRAWFARVCALVGAGQAPSYTILRNLTDAEFTAVSALISPVLELSAKHRAMIRAAGWDL